MGGADLLPARRGSSSCAGLLCAAVSAARSRGELAQRMPHGLWLEVRESAAMRSRVRKPNTASASSSTPRPPACAGAALCSVREPLPPDVDIVRSNEETGVG